MVYSRLQIQSSTSRSGQRGVAIISFAVAFTLLCGILTLILDVGWSFYTVKKAQAATDSAALAALSQALATNGPVTDPVCGTLPCQGQTPCPSTTTGTGALDIGCSYAAADGFKTGGEQGNQSIKVSAGTTSPAPGVPNVPVEYWVQVTAAQQMPQWFSGFLSTVDLNPTATSTAAIRRVDVGASLYLLNRSSDCFVSAIGLGLVCGEDFLALGFNTINARNGIYMSSSNASGLGLPAIAAGSVVGLATVNAPFTNILGQGGIQDVILGAHDWNTAPVNGFPDGDDFTDPFAGRPQPPMPTGLPNHPVPGGIIVGNLLSGTPTVLPPGNYYATLPILGIPTGLPITVTGNVVFSDGAASRPCSGFCNYVFYGGIVTAALSTVTMSPGRYVFVGSQPVAGGPGVAVSVGANAVVKDLTPLVNGQITQNTDAGEILIFTDKNYPGLVIPNILSAFSFPQARAGLMAGLEPQITLHGLNASSPDLPAELTSYAPVLIWQDRANTTLKYTSTGLLDRTCGGICSNILSVPGSQEMIIMGSQSGGHAGTNLYGTIYGPRLSWLTILSLLPGDTVAGPIQVITGALQMTLNSTLDIYQLPNPPSRLQASLVQ